MRLILYLVSLNYRIYTEFFIFIIKKQHQIWESLNTKTNATNAGMIK
jgi:hypothetical protein